MEWNNSHKNPPQSGEKVYYFGPNIGIGIGIIFIKRINYGT